MAPCSDEISSPPLPSPSRRHESPPRALMGSLSRGNGGSSGSGGNGGSSFTAELVGRPSGDYGSR